MRRRLLIGGLGILLATVAGVTTLPTARAAPPATGADVDALAGRCVRILDGNRPLGPASAPFRVKAAGLGSFLFLGRDGRFLTEGGRLSQTGSPTSGDIWTATPGRAGITLRSHRRTTVFDGVRVVDAENCAAFPEAELNVEGAPFTGTGPDGNLRGFVDSHAHLMSEQFLGGELHCGAPYSPLGVTVALSDCPDHGNNSALAVSEQVLSRPGPHDPVGWPTFRDWPRYDSLTHEQTYYRWIERAWRSGLRMIHNYYVQNRVLCEAYPLHNQPCDEMTSVRIQHRMLLGLQDYIDAQAGGRGRGFLRIVSSPAQARSVIAAGKLAVTLGIEVSEPFGCRVIGDRPQCDRRGIDRELDELNRMGIRQIILTHKFDNALGGARFDQGATGVGVDAGEQLATGHLWQVEPCRTHQHDNPMVGYPPNTCNARGLTDLGAYTVRGLMARRMVIDVDHLSVKSATAVLDIVGAAHYPGVVSSHTWTDKTNYGRILSDGGSVGLFATPAEADPGEVGRHGDMPPDFLSAWRVLRAQRDPRFFFGVGFGPDMGGLGKQAHPRPSAKTNPVRYPFVAADGTTRIYRQVSGRRVFDANLDGTAHYGMLPDWIESLRIQAGSQGPQLISDLFNAAEAYVRMWERVGR